MRSLVRVTIAETAVVVDSEVPLRTSSLSTWTRLQDITAAWVLGLIATQGLFGPFSTIYSSN